MDLVDVRMSCQSGTLAHESGRAAGQAAAESGEIAIAGQNLNSGTHTALRAPPNREAFSLSCGGSFEELSPRTFKFSRLGSRLFFDWDQFVA
jgi:hypothetical protein